MAFRRNLGRKITVKKNPITVRDLIRRHLREEGALINPHLAEAWNMHPTSAYRRMYETRSLTPAHIDAVINLLHLDEFDARELHTLGAIEAGWDIPFKDI